jgi:hypothetical protein
MAMGSECGGAQALIQEARLEMVDVVGLRE